MFVGMLVDKRPTSRSLSASILKRNANREPLNGDRGVQIFVEVAGAILPFLPPIDYLIFECKVLLSCCS